MLYLILHKVRGEPTFDVACKIHSQFLNDDIWIIPTSGHQCYPYRKWLLDDLLDISDVNQHGFHERPIDSLEVIPADWPDHYQAAEPRPKAAAPPTQATIEDLLI